MTVCWLNLTVAPVLDPEQSPESESSMRNVRLEDTSAAHRATATADYVEMLLNPARGPIEPRDREWALMRLASLRLQGCRYWGWKSV